MLDVCLLGTSGMMPLPGRWLTSLMLRYNGSSLLIDCGEGTQVAVKEKGWSFKPIDILCITHFHADHISGLPGLLLTMALLARGVTWLFRWHYAVAFHGILGIVAASTLVIVPIQYSGLGEVLVSAACCGVGFALAFFLERLDRALPR